MSFIVTLSCICTGSGTISLQGGGKNLAKKWSKICFLQILTLFIFCQSIRKLGKIEPNVIEFPTRYLNLIIIVMCHFWLKQIRWNKFSCHFRFCIFFFCFEINGFEFDKIRFTFGRSAKIRIIISVEKLLILN